MNNLNVSIYSSEEQDHERSILEEIEHTLIWNEESFIHFIDEDILILERLLTPDILPPISEILAESFEPFHLFNSIDDDLMNFENDDEEVSPGLSSEIIQTLPVNVVTDTNKSCIICLENYKLDELLTTLPCTHSFHKLCLEGWLQSHATCPICRQTILAQ